MTQTDDTSVAITLRVNGRDRHARVEARTSLADCLRETLLLTGTHVGCEQGVCGACTVLVDDVPVRACITLAAAVNGSEIVTVEGLAGPRVDALRKAFSAEHGLQCGFCTPGMLVAATDLLKRKPRLSPDQIRHEMSGNLCRCTGYVGIVKAIASAAEQLAESPDQRRGE
ncbi:MAG: (2Fe-2S)-binding protein [Pseudolabrys sp.]|nr:(2Fe-2S)-binding protein [Pseudolabrys sp.]